MSRRSAGSHYVPMVFCWIMVVLTGAMTVFATVATPP